MPNRIARILACQDNCGPLPREFRATPIVAAALLALLASGSVAQNIPLTKRQNSARPQPVVVATNSLRPANPVQQSTFVLPLPERKDESPTNALLLRSAERIRSHRTVTARIRQKIHMFGQNLAGSGQYEQANVDAEYLFRMQFQIALQDKQVTILQVCDGHFLWTSRTFADRPAVTQRVDLNLVRRYLDADRPGQGRAVHPTMMLNTGGLPHLLSTLAKLYDFSEPSVATLHKTPVLSMVGTLSEEAKNKFSRDGEASGAAAVPQHIPSMVTLALGKDDLFPFRMEFQDRPAKEADRENTLVEQVIVHGIDHPLLVIELFEVQYDAYVDPQRFEYRPIDIEVRDATQEFVSSLSNGPS